MKPHRNIHFFDETNEERLEREVELALKSTMEENLARYMQLIASLAAMLGIDIYNWHPERNIYFIEDDDQKYSHSESSKKKS